MKSSTRCLKLFSRSYFILRTKETTDPDPKVATVLLHVWPLMIFVALADLVILAIAAGLLGMHFLGDCQPNEENLAPKERLQQSLAQLEEDWIEAEMTDLNITVNQIKKKKEELKESLEAAGYGRIQQKIRICEDDSTEFKIRVGLLSGLVVIVVLAAVATYRLHKIADYKVFKLK